LAYFFVFCLWKKNLIESKPKNQT